MTNGDLLRMIGSEELAEWLIDHTCMSGDIERCDDYENCRECWKDWLAEEAEEVDGSTDRTGWVLGGGGPTLELVGRGRRVGCWAAEVRRSSLSDEADEKQGDER